MHGPGSLRAQCGRRADGGRPARRPLTPRQLDVLRLLAQGLSNAELAARFHLSEATVRTRVSRTLTKLSLRDRARAVVVAHETGLVSPRSDATEEALRGSAGRSHSVTVSA